MDLQAAGLRSEILKKLKSNQKILAVSKLQPIEKIKELHAEGQIDFGENYMQEALEKIETLKDLKINWHLIGPLQKNKVKFLKTNFAYVHSVDSIELAELISKKAVEINHKQKVFLQINISGEQTKAGFDENAFVKNWDLVKALPGLEIVGLMTMPPLENEPEKNRIYFKKLTVLGETLGLHEFSMGTSHDYLVALEEGATWIRLGTILFGQRSKLDK
ncbi:MAG: YggS family pyridoxal phosphate-dependent enzyme [Bdellovibrio sp.]|nr:YggS family pyridoxal phosphate-dependent enzyme [Bdellovibrio sp.]